MDIGIGLVRSVGLSTVNGYLVKRAPFIQCLIPS